MDSVNFCYWLQGLFELGNVKELNEQQVEVIKNHLNLVFKHDIDPKVESSSWLSKDELNELHDPKPITDDNPIILRC